MKRKVIILLIIAAALSAAVSAAATARTVTKQLTYRGTRIFVNGEETALKDANGNVVEPFIIDGTTYLPVRGVSESLGCVVIWDGEENRINIYGEKEYEKATLAGDKNAFEKYYITDTNLIDELNNAKPNSVILNGNVILTKDANSKITGMKNSVLLNVIIQDNRKQESATDGPQMWYATKDSSCFWAIAYENGNIYVCFSESLRQYVYYDVPESVWTEFSNSESLGTYYNKFIKNNYKFDRIK